MRIALIFIVFVGIIRLSNAQSLEPFIPNIVSIFPAVRDIAISSNGNEAYIKTSKVYLCYMHLCVMHQPRRLEKLTLEVELPRHQPAIFLTLFHSNGFC